jgi:hypothetical protein
MGEPNGEGGEKLYQRHGNGLPGSNPDQLNEEGMTL